MNIDFILVSFPPVPDGMWLATSAMLDVTLRKCMKLLGGLAVLKMMYDRYEGYEEMNVAIHIRTLFSALMMIVFFRYYKQLLMYFDHFIDALCIHESGGQLVVDKLRQLGHHPPPMQDPASFKALWRFLKFFLKFIPHLTFLGSHMGVIYFMHYIRAVSLLLMIQVGPIAALLSWLPGPFTKAFQQWRKSYVTISCQAITLQMFSVLSQSFGVAAIAQGKGAMIGHTVLSIVLLLIIFMTPSWTAKFIGGDTLGNFVSGVGGLVSKAGKIATKRLPVSKL